MYIFDRPGVAGAVLQTPPLLREAILNKIEIRPIDALFEVLEFTTFSIYLVFQFE